MIENQKSIVIKKLDQAYLIECFIGDKLLRSEERKSHTKIVDVLKQAGAVKPHKQRAKHRFTKWPVSVGDQVIFTVDEPVAWFWSES